MTRNYADRRLLSVIYVQFVNSSRQMVLQVQHSRHAFRVWLHAGVVTRRAAMDQICPVSD